jgi:hypothetical protein
MQRIFIKKIFPVYGRKCLLRKGVHNLVKKFSRGRSKVTDDARPSAEVAETTVKTSMLRVSTQWQSEWTSVSMLVEDMSRNKCFFFQIQKSFTFHTYL